MKDRIKKIMESEDLSAAKFADKLQINRAVISHILNGRNNPSLDVVMKILSEMDYINSDWLLSDVGSMYKDGYVPKEEKERSLFSTDTLNTEEDADEIKYAKENTSNNMKNPDKYADMQVVSPTSTITRKVKQIIIYYTDNTFETFTPH